MVKASSILCLISSLTCLVIAINFFLISKKYERAHIPVQVMNMMIVAFICQAVLVSYSQLLNSMSVHSVTATLVE